MKTNRKDDPGQDSWEHQHENESKKMERFGEDREDDWNNFISPGRNDQSQDMRSDNDDFNDSGWGDMDNRYNSREDSSNVQSAGTFKDDETRSSHGRYSDTDLNRYSSDYNRRNREEME